MDGSEKMKTGLECFQNLKIEMQWQYSNFIQLKGPTALSCHVMSCHVISCHVMSCQCPQRLFSLSQTFFSFFFLFFFYIEPPPIILT